MSINYPSQRCKIHFICEKVVNFIRVEIASESVNSGQKS